MTVKVRRLQPGDEELALQVVRKLMPEDERDGREPTMPHLVHFLEDETNFLIVAVDNKEGHLTSFIKIKKLYYV